jgi:hypothetical protein
MFENRSCMQESELHCQWRLWQWYNTGYVKGPGQDTTVVITMQNLAQYSETKKSGDYYSPADATPEY